MYDSPRIQIMQGRSRCMYGECNQEWDGTPNYQYALLYVDDVLVVAENPESIIRSEIGKYFAVKEESIGMPNVYLGGNFGGNAQ